MKLTEEQSLALESKLNEDDNLSDYKCFIVMRCWHPRAENVVKEVINYNPDEIILMPLYPQFSAATSGSSIKEWNDMCVKNNYKVKTSTICCYPTDENFVEAHKSEIIKKISSKNKSKYKIDYSVSGEAFLTKPNNTTFMIRDIIKKITKIKPQLSTTGGTSDARFIRKIAPCLEFGLVGKTMHKVDEAVSLSDLKKLTLIYSNILQNYFK